MHPIDKTYQMVLGEKDFLKRVAMKIFVSSVIGGMEMFRNAVAEAIETLGHDTIRAEDFDASPDPPRLSCLQAVRNSDVVILIIGERYGDKQRSGLSATHEEYREACKTHRPVIVMVQENVSRDLSQDNFLQEVRGWEDGRYTGSFDSPDGLFKNTIRALHKLSVQQAQGPVDADEISNRALNELSREEHLRLYRKIQPRPWLQDQEHYFQRTSPQSPALALSLSCGPRTNILRPAQIESSDLKNHLRGIALRGTDPFFSIDDGAQTHVDEGKLVIVQENRFVRLDEYGTLTYVTVVQRPSPLLIIVEEDVKDEITRFVEFSKNALDHIDDSNRLSHCGIAAILLNATYSDWKTRSQYRQDPNSSSVPLIMSQNRMQPVALSPPTFRRTELASQKTELVEDLIIKLRRVFYP